MSRRRGNQRITSNKMLRQAEEKRRQEIFNIGHHYSELLGAAEAAQNFIKDVYDAQGNVWFSQGEEWSETLQEYSVKEDDDPRVAADKALKRGFAILAFFCAGSTFLVSSLVKQWNGQDPFAAEIKKRREEMKNGEA